jgi:hypothetical protein
MEEVVPQLKCPQHINRQWSGPDNSDAESTRQGLRAPMHVKHGVPFTLCEVMSEFKIAGRDSSAASDGHHNIRCVETS